MCVTVFSTGGKFRPVSILRSYTLLLYSPVLMRSWLCVITYFVCKVYIKCFASQDSRHSHDPRSQFPRSVKTCIVCLHLSPTPSPPLPSPPPSPPLPFPLLPSPPICSPPLPSPPLPSPPLPSPPLSFLPFPFAPLPSPPKMEPVWEWDRSGNGIGLGMGQVWE